MKKCSQCGEEKDENEFYKCATTKDRLMSKCKNCFKKQSKERYEKHKDEINQKKRENRSYYLEKERDYISRNREKVAARKRKYRQENKETIRAYEKEYKAKNADKVKQWDKNKKLKFAKYDTYYDQLKLYNECRQDPDNPELLQVKCKYCGKWFNPTVRQVTNRLSSIKNLNCGESELYCSEGCKQACPIYNQKEWPKGFKPETSREVQPELRKMVLERDNWTCQKCGVNKEIDPGVELHCHHIFPLNEDPVCSADMDTCITLCIDCHHEAHKLPGCGYNELKCSK